MGAFFRFSFFISFINRHLLSPFLPYPFTSDTPFRDYQSIRNHSFATIIKKNNDRARGFFLRASILIPWVNTLRTSTIHLLGDWVAKTLFLEKRTYTFNCISIYLLGVGFQRTLILYLSIDLREIFFSFLFFFPFFCVCYHLLLHTYTISTIPLFIFFFFERASPFSSHV